MDTEKDIDMIVWDLETTGFVAPECKILEIGAFVVTGDKVETKHWVLHNKDADGASVVIPEKITEITGITQEIIDAEGRDPAECLAEFLPLFKRAKMNVTHNGVRFDIPFLTNYSKDVMGYTDEQADAMRKLIERSAFDTAVHFKADKLNMRPREDEPFIIFAKRVMDVRAFGVKYNLALCAEEIKLDMTGIVAHRALADVDVTYRIFKTLFNTES